MNSDPRGLAAPTPRRANARRGFNGAGHNRMRLYRVVTTEAKPARSAALTLGQTDESVELGKTARLVSVKTRF
jgi:hypothetical protein